MARCPLAYLVMPRGFVSYYTMNLLQKSYHTSPQPFRLSVFSQPFFTRLTVSDHRGARQLLLADPGKFRLSAGEQTTDGLDQDHVCRPGLQTAGFLEG